MKASQYGIANLKYILAHLNEWVEGEDRDYSYRTDIYKGHHQPVYPLHRPRLRQRRRHLPQQRSTWAIRWRPTGAFRRSGSARRFSSCSGRLDDLDWLDNEGLMQNIQLMGSPKTYMQVAIIRAVVMSAAKVENPRSCPTTPTASRPA